MTRVARAKLAAAALLLFLPAIGMYAGYYLEKKGLLPTLLAAPTPPSTAEMTIGPPTNNRLSNIFIDSDGDLLADPPEPSEQINPSPLVLVMADAGDDADLATRWRPLLDHLAKDVGKPVRLEVSSADDQYRLRAMRQGEVHLAIIGAGAVPTAVNAAGFVPVAIVPTDQGDGLTRMQLIVPAASPAMSPFDLRNMELVFVEPYSNTGFKSAVLALRSDFGLRPSRDFTWRFTGTHRESIRQIAEGSAPAAAVAADALRQEIAAGRIRPEDFRVIHESEVFPSAAIGYGHKLNTKLASRVRKALLSFDWKGTALEPLLGSQRTRFMPANYRESWSLIRRIDDATGAVHVIR